jgi:transcriptional regulator with XRE-family HTH domain
MTPYFQTMGNYLKKNRAAMGLSQQKVASFLGYSSAQFVSNVERGLCMFPLTQAKKLVKIYKLDPNEFKSLVIEQNVKQIKKEMGL